MFTRAPDLRFIGAVISSLALCLIGLDIIRDVPNGPIGPTSILLWIGLSMIGCLGLLICAFATPGPSATIPERRVAVPVTDMAAPSAQPRLHHQISLDQALASLRAEPKKTASVIRSWISEDLKSDA